MISYDDMGGEEYEMVAERGWRSRAYVYTVPGIPPEVMWWFAEVKRRHGAEIARLVFYAYEAYGRREAEILARRLLQFESFEDALRLLEHYASYFDEKGRRALSGLIYEYKYVHYFRQLLDVLDESHPGDSPAREASIALFHAMASHGVFYAPACVVNFVEVALGLAPRLKNKCKDSAKHIEKYWRELGRGVRGGEG